MFELAEGQPDTRTELVAETNLPVEGYVDRTMTPVVGVTVFLDEDATDDQVQALIEYACDHVLVPGNVNTYLKDVLAVTFEYEIGDLTVSSCAEDIHRLFDEIAYYIVEVDSELVKQ